MMDDLPDPVDPTMARCFENNLSPSHFIPILEYKLGGL